MPAPTGPTVPDGAVQAAMRRVWAVYDPAYAELTAMLRERLAEHPEFGPLVRATPPDTAEDERNHALLGAAMERGEWEAYWESVRGSATRYATAEISFAAWIELIHMLRAAILERVFAAHGAEPAALLEACTGLDRWLDDVTAVFGQAFVATNEQLIAAQQKAIRQLSTPVLQLRPGLLILPMVGTLDRDRLEQLRTDLLDGISRRRARVVVLDVTGVPAIDSMAANELIGAVAGARMMGAEVIVSGLSAEIAQTLVTVGIDLGLVVSAGDLESGIDLAEGVLRGAG